jgi:hypothetical protein
MMKRLAPALGLFVGAASCVFIIEPGGNNPTPTPVPLTCNPQTLIEDVPIIHVYFATRIERGTFNLADKYGKVMTDVALGLAALDANVTTGVIVRQDERPVSPTILAAYGCTLDNPFELLPADVIRYYALNSDPDDVNLGCAIDPLISLGEHLTDAVTQYPPGLSGTNGVSVFGSAPDLVLIVHLDSLGRETGFDEPGCAAAKRALEGGDDGNATWLNYAGSVPHDRIVHWFFTTEELVSREAFVNGCKQVDGFPSSLLDNLEESRKAFYVPMADLVADRGASVAALPMCRMLVEPEEQTFLKDQISHVAGILGLQFDEERLTNVLNGGLPALHPPPEAGGEAIIPGG